MSWKSFKDQDHAGGDQVALTILHQFDDQWPRGDSSFLEALKKFCAAKGYNCITCDERAAQPKQRYWLKRFASAIAAEGGLNPAEGLHSYILQEQGGYDGGSAPTASDWEKFSDEDHGGSVVGEIKIEIEHIANDPAWISAMSEFCAGKGFNAIATSKNDDHCWFKKFASPIAAKGGKKPNGFINLYVAKPGPASSGWQCFPGQDHFGADVMGLAVHPTSQVSANDPAVVKAMKVLCDEKGYNAFNIAKDGKGINIKKFSSPLEAEQGLEPYDLDFYLKK